MTAGGLQVNANRFPSYVSATSKVPAVTPKIAGTTGRTLYVRTTQAGVGQVTVAQGQVCSQYPVPKINKLS